MKARAISRPSASARSCARSALGRSLPRRIRRSPRATRSAAALASRSTAWSRRRTASASAWRKVGIAGGKAKCDFVVKDLKFDACIDYKGGNVRDGLKEHCPKGVDIYFDNVGGEILDTVLTRINRNARIVICGAISQYNNTTPVKGPSNYLSLLVNRARMQGMVVFDYADRFGIAVREIQQWMKEGKFIS